MLVKFPPALRAYNAVLRFNRDSILLRVGPPVLQTAWYQSFRFRLLVPILAAAIIAASAVGVFSFSWGSQWASNDVQERAEAVRNTLDKASFPLTGNVVNSLAQLTGCELVAITNRGTIQSSLELNESGAGLTQIEKFDMSPQPCAIAAREFLRFSARLTGATNADTRIHVLFDKATVDAASRRAAFLPLLTGVSTTLLLSVVMLWLANSLARRLGVMEQRVASVAAGEFDVRSGEKGDDELGRLGQAVDSMAAQLQQLWNEVNRQQSSKLLHQIAGGMAHQLRNTLTGSKMAIELHAQSLTSQSEEVKVALRQLGVAEDYVKRLLLVGRGQQGAPEPGQLGQALRDLQDNMNSIASHLQCQLAWELMLGDADCTLTDAGSFQAAISNLILNAVQVSDCVKVQARLQSPELLSIVVRDNGPGVDPKIESELFEPFVTTKPEGMGLGLPLVKRSAEQLQGKVEWRREDGWTVFEFQCAVQSSL